MNPQNKRRLIVLVLFIVACVLATVLFFGISYLTGWAKVYRCAEHLSHLKYPFKEYADNHDGRYPPCVQWCDLLIATDAGFARDLVCKAGSPARSHYAMNRHATPDSPGNVVLLFETDGGWNQSGGVELLTTDNHKGKGCNVLYVGGYVQFVRSKDIDKLRWKVGLGED